MPQIINTNNRKAPKHAQHESAEGIRIAPGPFVGIVRNNVDPLRAGRLQVWIPELGGDSDDAAAWRIVNYCSPFFGVTDPSIRKKGEQTFQFNPHSYGMWMVPPDVGNKVLCTFVNGDPFRGYWFGCVPEWPNLHMVPGLASGSWHGAGPEPLVEYNDAGEDPGTEGDFYKRASVKHDYQTEVWNRQGLLGDPIRGPGTSSAFRETPSRVFGISTPGPELVAPAGLDEENQEADYRVKGRQGGHQFVMDDGDAQGNSQLIRLRTSNGNMLLMNDSAGIVYMINAKGNAWFELDGNGNIKAFAQGQLAVTAQGGITLDTKGAISLNGASISLTAKTSVSIKGMNVSATGMMGVSLSSAGPMSLTSAMKMNLSANMCIGVNSLMHVDIKGGCVTLNTNKPKPSMPPIPSPSPPPATSHEPYGGHANSRSSSPATSPSYGSSNGLPDGAAGKYGAASSFGNTANIPQYYGVQTSANGPIKFNSGYQGSLAGQGSNLGDAAFYNEYDQNSISYRNVGLDLPVAVNGFAIDIKNSETMNVAGLSPAERLNNPGGLRDLSEDPFAVGKVNGLNMYSTPEDGIAALTLALDLIQSRGATNVQEFITQFIAKKGNII